MILIPGEAEAAEDQEGSLPLERIIGPFYAFRNAGAKVVLASSEDGIPSLGLARHDQVESALVERYKHDRVARNELNDPLRLEQIYPEDFDAAFCLGNPGALWETPSPAGALLGAFLRQGKPVAVFPGSLDVSPHGAGSGLLIMDNRSTAPALAAEALLGALGLKPLPQAEIFSDS